MGTKHVKSLAPFNSARKVDYKQILRTFYESRIDSGENDLRGLKNSVNGPSSLRQKYSNDAPRW